MSKRGKTTCRVKFEDYSGNLRTTTVRVPHKAPLTTGRIVTLASYKTGKKVANVFSVECATSGGKRRGFLPHMRRR